MEKIINPLMVDASDAKFWGFVAAVIAAIITIVIFIIWRRRSVSGHFVLLTGLSDSGKTLLFSQLLHSKFIETYTSAKENVGKLDANNSALQLVDIPGHERLRYKYFDKYKGSARGLIFLVDSSTIQKDIKDAAECLYTLLSDPAIEENVPVLILCNKQDQTLSKGSVVIKIMLEKEMNLLRLSKTNQLEATDASSTNCYLGKRGRDFEFAHLRCKVEFGECSAISKEQTLPVDINHVNGWLQKIA